MVEFYEDRNCRMISTNSKPTILERDCLKIELPRDELLITYCQFLITIENILGFLHIHR